MVYNMLAIGWRGLCGEDFESNRLLTIWLNDGRILRDSKCVEHSNY